MDPVSEDDRAVECEARLRTVPVHEIGDGAVVGALAALGREAVQDCRLRLAAASLTAAGLDARKPLLRRHVEWASDCSYTILVHNGVMPITEKVVRQSVSLPTQVAKQVASIAKSRKLSKNRVLLELIENGIEAEKRKQEQFFALAQRFRDEEDPEAANRLGDELGRLVFGG